MLEKGQKSKMIFSILFITFLLGLVYIFPYSGDDWAWGGQIGLDRFKNGFVDYNGRYLGNLLVIVLTRSVVLKTIVISTVIFLTIYLANQYTTIKVKGNLVLYIGSLLILSMPRTMFMQGIVWTAGFSNYFPPIFLIAIYLVITKNIFDDNIPKYNKVMIPIVFLLGISSTLFMEHVTLYSVLLGIYILIYAIMKFKKVNLTHIAYLIGAGFGATLMFSNSAYGIIAKIIPNKVDNYRKIAESTNVFQSIKDALVNVIYKELSFNNVVVNTILVIVLIYIINKSKDKIVLGEIIKYFSVFYVSYTVVKALNPEWMIFLEYTKYFEAILSIVFYIMLLLSIGFFIKNPNSRDKLFMLTLSLGALTVPLFIVKPIGARCFVPMYVMYIFIIGELISNVDLETSKIKLINKTIITILVVFAIYLTSIYGYIGLINRERIESVQRGIKSNATEIIIPELPYSANCNYVWVSKPIDIWLGRFKLFYNIPKDTKLKLVPFEEWQEKYKNSQNLNY